MGHCPPFDFYTQFEYSFALDLVIAYNSRDASYLTTLEMEKSSKFILDSKIQQSKISYLCIIWMASVSFEGYALIMV